MTNKNVTAKSRLSFLSGSKAALSIKTAAILFTIWAIYSSDLFTMKDEAIQSSFATYLLAIPFLFAYLIFRERKMLRAVIPLEIQRYTKKPFRIREIVGILLTILAFLFYWQGSFSPYPLESHLVSLPLFLAGLILLIFNFSTLRTLILPIAFLLFLVPPPPEIVYSIGAFLATHISKATYVILKMFGTNAGLTTQLGIPTLTLERPGALPLTLVMDVAFVGTYPMIVFSVFWVFLTFAVGGAPWKRVLMLLAWFPSILISNIMRITVLTVMAYRFGVDATSEGLFTIGVWFLTLTGTFLFLMLVSRKILGIQIFAAKPTTSCIDCDQSVQTERSFCPKCGALLRYLDVKISRQDILKIGALIILANLLASSRVPALALKDGRIEVNTYLPREGMITTPVLPEIAGYSLSFNYTDKKLEKMIDLNESLTYVYTPTEGSPLLPKVYGTMSTNVSEVAPVLRGEILDSKEAQVLRNPPVTGRLVSLHRPDSNLTLVILYWYERAVFDTESTIVRRQIRVILFTSSNSSTDCTSAEGDLLAVGHTVARHLEPARVWSDISSLFPEYLFALSVLVVGILGTISAIQIMGSRREKRLNLRVFNKLAAEDDKTVLRAVYQAEKAGKSKPDAIASSFQNLAGKSIDQSKLLDTLRNAEELDLVRSSVANEEGEPTLVWKTRIAFPSSKLHLRRIRNLFLDQVVY